MSFVAGIETPLVVVPIIHLRRLVVVVISRRDLQKLNHAMGDSQKIGDLSDLTDVSATNEFEMVWFEKPQPHLTLGPLCDFFGLLMCCDYTYHFGTSDNG